MAKEDEISTPSLASKPVSSPNPAQKTPSLPQSKPPEEVNNVGNNNSPASRNVKSSVDFVRSVAEKIAAKPFQYSDPDVWGVLTSITEKARKRHQGMNMLLTNNEHTIGRMVDDDRFQIVSPAVSAQHCKIYRRRVATGDTEQESDNCFSIFLKDSSTNGTYLNWDKLTKTSSEAKLRHGDIISIAFAPQHEHAFAFVFREVQKSSRVSDCSSLKRKPEEYGADSKRLKGIGLGASDGPISLDDFRSLQRSNTELRKHLENEVATVESLRAENRAAVEKHENELKELRESVAKSYEDQLSQLNHHLEAKDKELAELNKISAEQKHGIEDLNERLGASIQSCLEANEIINSQKASISELKGLLEEERDQRREEREKASLDMKVALQKVQAEAAEEIKRVSDGASRREKEQQEMINKLQEADKERCSLMETLRSKLEDTRQKLVNSDYKVRQLEGQMREEQQGFTTTQKRVEELEHEIKRLRKELEREKAAREEAWAKVSALELEISAAVRDLDFERRRLKAARERIMLRETQLRAFYSTTEEISVLFAKQQEQLKSMQRTLEDEENYETTSTDFDGNRNHRSSAGDEEEEARQSNTTAKGRDESSSDEASVTEKHECNNVQSQGENGPNTQEVEFVGPLLEDGKGAFGSDINGVGTQPELSHGDLIGTEQIPETEGGCPAETERVMETESQNARHLNSNSTMHTDNNKKNIDEDNGNKNRSQSSSPVEAGDTMEEETEEGGTIKTNDLLASEIAGSWACSTAPSVHGENEYPHSPTHDSSSLVAESQHIPLTKSGGDVDRMSHERRALSEMIGIVAPDLREQFSLAVGPEEGVASDSESKGCNEDDDDVDNEGRESGSDDDERYGERVRSEDRMEEDDDDDTQEDSMG
ncbi:SMAD/FHA domain-containing protein [Striga asiatica]|uniref:SMAD/FHA domain-containing protein n=1 Tax=Striga asiatica TaxID=4170 RepID=A0A5A7RJQ4_STRAF|nr:SMAD/FHA domain-containing protein [Striga asiatica]